MLHRCSVPSIPAAAIVRPSWLYVALVIFVRAPRSLLLTTIVLTDLNRSFASQIRTVLSNEEVRNLLPSRGSHEQEESCPVCPLRRHAIQRSMTCDRAGDVRCVLEVTDVHVPFLIFRSEEWPVISA